MAERWPTRLQRVAACRSAADRIARLLRVHAGRRGGRRRRGWGGWAGRRLRRRLGRRPRLRWSCRRRRKCGRCWWRRRRFWWRGRRRRRWRAGWRGATDHKAPKRHRLIRTPSDGVTRGEGHIHWPSGATVQPPRHLEVVVSLFRLEEGRRRVQIRLDADDAHLLVGVSAQPVMHASAVVAHVAVFDPREDGPQVAVTRRPHGRWRRRCWRWRVGAHPARDWALAADGSAVGRVGAPAGHRQTGTRCVCARGDAQTPKAQHNGEQPRRRTDCSSQQCMHKAGVLLALERVRVCSPSSSARTFAAEQEGGPEGVRASIDLDGREQARHDVQGDSRTHGGRIARCRRLQEGKNAKTSPPIAAISIGPPIQAGQHT